MSELRAKLAAKVAWRLFFFDRELTDLSALNQFVGAEAAEAAIKDKPFRIVILCRGDSIAWWRMARFGRHLSLCGASNSTDVDLQAPLPLHPPAKTLS